MKIGIWTQPYLDFKDDGSIESFADILSEAKVDIVLPCVKSEAHFTDGKSIAFYGSKLLENGSERDILAELCEASRKRGLEIHPWVCVFLEGNSKFLRDNPHLRGMSFDYMNHASPTVMACPARREVRDFELGVLEEIMEYPINGLHLDFIRYQGLQSCACKNCRREFADETGFEAEDILSSGAARIAWLKRRRDTISSFVVRVSELAGSRGIKLSTAVFPEYPASVDNVGQDWVSWCREGLVDFVVPMNYGSSEEVFLSRAAAHIAALGSGERLFEGISKCVEKLRLDPDELLYQLRTAKELGCSGAVIFSYWGFSHKDFQVVRSMKTFSGTV